MSSSSSFSSSSIPTVTDPRHELFIAKHAYLNPHIKPDRRRSTKHNPGPKLYLGYELENLEEAYAGTYTERKNFFFSNETIIL